MRLDVDLDERDEPLHGLGIVPAVAAGVTALVPAISKLTRRRRRRDRDQQQPPPQVSAATEGRPGSGWQLAGVGVGGLIVGFLLGALAASSGGRR